MKKLSNNMRILIQWIIGFIFIAITISIYNWYFHQSVLNHYQTTKDSRELLGLMEKNPDESELSMQEIYDLFYNRYKDFNDGTFYNGYTQAYSTCTFRNEIRKKKHKSCDIHSDGSWRFYMNAIACEKNYDNFCIGHTLVSKGEKFENKIYLFEKSVLKNNNCDSQIFQEFFISLSQGDRDKLDKNVIEICNKK